MPKVPVPNYKEEVLKAARANMAEVVPLLDAADKKMLEKIENFSERFDFDLAEVKDKIRKDRIFLARFAKDPGRQGIHEKLAGAFIKKLPNVSDFETLSKSKWVLVRGAVVTRSQFRANGGSHTAKTIDFHWRSGANNVYASHKYTGLLRGGGMQTNQYEDIRHFIEEANPSNLADTYFLAIADGDYYKGRDTGTNTTRLEALKRLANNRNVFALSSGELEDFLARISTTRRKTTHKTIAKKRAVRTS